MSNYNLSAKERLLASLKKANPESLVAMDVNNITFGIPVVMTTGNTNTKITLTPNTPVNTLQKVIGVRTVRYNRLDLTTFFGIVATTPLVVDVATRTVDLLPLIYEQYNVRIEPYEIVDEPIVNDIYRITATAASVGWIGSHDFTTDVSTVYDVLTTDSGAAIMLDSGAILING